MKLLSIREVADRLSTKESTVRTWINRGQIPEEIVFRIGNTVRIREEKFNRWVNGECI
jgi:excisionase family DNA binding protein